jgi:hypothetical protein
MTTLHTVAACAFALTIGGQPVDAQDLSRYRAFDLGASVATVSAATGVASSEATVLHQRPALLQDLEWRPSRWIAGSTAESTDPVERIVFRFYNDRLFQLVVDYGRDRTEGMTDADMIAAISTAYGSINPTRSPGRVQSPVEIESGTPVARWADATNAVVLYRTSSYRQVYRLIVTNAGDATLARKGTTQALRLDEQEAPQREIARQKKERDDARAAADKARHANKGQFIP